MGPGVAAVVVLAHLGAEVVAVEVAGGEDTRGVVGAEGEAEEVEEEGACKLLGANIPCAILVRNFVVDIIHVVNDNFLRLVYGQMSLTSFLRLVYGQMSLTSFLRLVYGQMSLTTGQ